MGTGLIPLLHRKSFIMAKKIKNSYRSLRWSSTSSALLNLFERPHPILEKQAPFCESNILVIYLYRYGYPTLFYFYTPCLTPSTFHVCISPSYDDTLSHCWNKKDLPEEGKWLHAELVNSKNATYANIFTNRSKILV